MVATRRVPVTAGGTAVERRRGADRRSGQDRRTSGWLHDGCAPRQTMDLRAGSDRRSGNDRRRGDDHRDINRARVLVSAARGSDPRRSACS